MADPTASEPLPKRQRLDQNVWEDKLRKAEADHQKAAREIEIALDEGNDAKVQYWTKMLDSAQEDKKFVHAMLLKSQSPEVDLGAAIQNLSRQFADSQDLAITAFQAVLTPDLAQSTKERDPEFRNNVAQYQGYNQNAPCAVLSQRFPGTFEYWREHGIFIFPSVADHIYPHKNFGNFKTLGFHRDDVKNGMLLFKDIEERAGNGELSFMPAQVSPDEIILQVHVSELIWDVYLQYKEPMHKKQFGDWPLVFVWESVDGVCSGEPSPIRFGDLHDFKFKIKRLHLRALFWKAKMAHDAFNDLPDPLQHLQAFQECESLMDKIRRMNRSSDHVSQGSEKPT